MHNINTKVVFTESYKQDVIDITIMITNKCNYSCVYCIENIQLLKNKCTCDLNLNVAYDFINCYIKYFKEKKLTIRIYGGEPTLHDGLLEFCQQLNCIQNISVIEIFTNFSAKYELYKNLIKLDKIHFFISYHINDIMTSNDFTKKLMLLIKNNNINNRLICNIMLESYSKNAYRLTYDLYKCLYKLLAHYAEIKIDLELVPILSTENYYSKYSYQEYKLMTHIINFNNTKEKITCIDDNNNVHIMHALVGYDSCNFRSWQCSAGKNSLFIDMYGNVFPCCQYFKKKTNMIFNILTMQFSDFNMKNISHTTVCAHDQCYFDTPLYAININNISTKICDFSEKFNIVK